MSAILRLRFAAAVARPAFARPAIAAFTQRPMLAAPSLLKNSIRQYSSHDDESFEEFTARYVLVYFCALS